MRPTIFAVLLGLAQVANAQTNSLAVKQDEQTNLLRAIYEVSVPTSSAHGAVTVAGITRSSVTITAGLSRQFFAADANRKDFSVTSLPTNTDYVIGRWGGPAVSTDTIIINPGETWTPAISVSTLSLHFIANSSSQVLRGTSYAP